MTGDLRATFASVAAALEEAHRPKRVTFVISRLAPPRATLFSAPDEDLLLMTPDVFADIAKDAERALDAMFPFRSVDLNVVNLAAPPHADPASEAAAEAERKRVIAVVTGLLGANAALAQTLTSAPRT